jgi:hypothetical protein
MKYLQVLVDDLVVYHGSLSPHSGSREPEIVLFSDRIAPNSPSLLTKYVFNLSAIFNRSPSVSAVQVPVVQTVKYLRNTRDASKILSFWPK